MLSNSSICAALYSLHYAQNLSRRSSPRSRYRPRSRFHRCEQPVRGRAVCSARSGGNQRADEHWSRTGESGWNFCAEARTESRGICEDGHPQYASRFQYDRLAVLLPRCCRGCVVRVVCVLSKIIRECTGKSRRVIPSRAAGELCRSVGRARTRLRYFFRGSARQSVVCRCPRGCVLDGRRLAGNADADGSQINERRGGPVDLGLPGVFEGRTCEISCF